MEKTNPIDIAIPNSLPIPAKEFWIDPDDNCIGARENGQPPTRHEWTDERCLIQVRKCCVWREIPEGDFAGHLISFANLWLSGEVENMKDICSIIRNVLLITPVELSNQLLLENVFASAVKRAQTIPAVERENSILKEPLVDHLESKAKADVLTFHNWLKEHFVILQTGKQKQNPSTNQLDDDFPEYNLVSQRLRIVLGFYALVLLRIMTKSEQQISRYFPDGARQTFHQLFPNAGISIPLVAPSPKLLKIASNNLSRSYRDNMPRHLFSLLIFQYLKSKIKTDELSRIRREILGLGCLEVMAGNGLGLVSLFMDVCKICPDIEVQRLLSIICVSEEDAVSHKRLTQFLDMYALKDKPQYSWRWARILCENYFSDLNIKGNQSLCSKLAALQGLIHKKRRTFEHKDLKSPNPFADDAIEWAKSVKTELGILDSREKSIKVAREFMASLKAMKLLDF